MRPIGCPVTILNTIDHLGKFDGKADEGLVNVGIKRLLDDLKVTAAKVLLLVYVSTVRVKLVLLVKIEENILSTGYSLKDKNKAKPDKNKYGMERERKTEAKGSKGLKTELKRKFSNRLDNVLEGDANDEEIKFAYRRLAKYYHPDGVYVAKRKAHNSQMIKDEEAYLVLSRGEGRLLAIKRMIGLRRSIEYDSSSQCYHVVEVRVDVVDCAV
ncbi:ribonuclease H-like domain-containing protein [Tanacetum coccineum]